MIKYEYKYEGFSITAEDDSEESNFKISGQVYMIKLKDAEGKTSGNQKDFWELLFYLEKAKKITKKRILKFVYYQAVANFELKETPFYKNVVYTLSNELGIKYIPPKEYDCIEDGCELKEGHKGMCFFIQHAG